MQLLLFLHNLAPIFITIALVPQTYGRAVSIPVNTPTATPDTLRASYNEKRRPYNILRDLTNVPYGTQNAPAEGSKAILRRGDDDGDDTQDSEYQSDDDNQDGEYETNDGTQDGEYEANDGTQDGGYGTDDEEGEDSSGSGETVDPGLDGSSEDDGELDGSPENYEELDSFPTPPSSSPSSSGENQDAGIDSYAYPGADQPADGVPGLN